MGILQKVYGEGEGEEDCLEGLLVEDEEPREWEGNSEGL